MSSLRSLASRISEIINFLRNVPREIEARDIQFVNKIVWVNEKLVRREVLIILQISFELFSVTIAAPRNSALNAFKAFLPVCIFHSNATVKLNS